MAQPYRDELLRLAWEANHLRENVRMVYGKMIADINDRTGDDLLSPLLEFRSEREIAEHPDPLFDSGRTYEEQIAKYKFFKGRDQEWAARHREKRRLKAKEDRAKKTPELIAEENARRREKHKLRVANRRDIGIRKHATARARHDRAPLPLAPC